MADKRGLTDYALSIKDDLFSWIKSRIRSRQEAEDIVGELLLRAMKHDGNVEPKAFRRWCYTTAQHLVTDYYRSCSSRARFVHRLQPNEVYWEENTLRRLLITEALQKLPLHYREIAVLQRLHHKSSAEIAEMLGLTLSAVKGRAQKGNLLLRRNLGTQLLPA